MPSIGAPPYRRGSKKSTDMKVGVLNGKPAIQVNWGGRIYGTQLSLIGSGNTRDALNVGDIKATGNITFGKNSSVYNNSNRLIMVGGIITPGDGNLAIGGDTNLSSLQNSGTYNIAIGHSNSTNLTTGDQNVCIGFGAGNSITTVGQNVMIGTLSGYTTNDSAFTGIANVFLGFKTGYLGSGAAEGDYSVYIGSEAGLSAEGDDNIGIGRQTLQSATSASNDNIAIGFQAGGAGDTGQYISGAYNIMIGYEAGSQKITSGDKNILIGYQCDLEENGSNRVALGNSITVNDDNTTIIGNTDIILDAASDIILDSAAGKFVMKGGGTVKEFSVADSAYAGMILGVTVDGINQAQATYDLTTSEALVASSTHHVSFIAPPSTAVEIEVQIGFDAGTGGERLFLGLSDNTTIGSNGLAAYLLQTVCEPSTRQNDVNVIHKWIVTGLTAGTSYKWYLTAKASATTGTPTLKWGGDAADEDQVFIMKAIALPTAISNYAIYS